MRKQTQRRYRKALDLLAYFLDRSVCYFCLGPMSDAMTETSIRATRHHLNEDRTSKCKLKGRCQHALVITHESCHRAFHRTHNHGA